MTRASGALAYFLRATRVVLQAKASARGADIGALLAATGQHLADS